MSANMTGEQLGAKIASARHEAEGLKDRIKRRKDELADTTRKKLTSSTPSSSSSPCFNACRSLLLSRWPASFLLVHVLHQKNQT